MSDTMIVYAGLYDSLEEAENDFVAIKMAHAEKWIGFYESAVFTKAHDGKVKVLNTDATVRSGGAKVGAIAGAIFGVIFPPSILVSALTGAAVGGGIGHLAKGFDSGDIKAIAEGLEPGQAGVILIGEATFEDGAERLLKRAKKVAKQAVEADAKAIKDEIDAL